MKINTYRLNNGIRVIHQQVDSPAAHFGIILNTGSRDEQSSEQGIAHFIEHIIFKGTQKRKAFHIISRMEDVGGELNAYTGKEETAIYASFLNEHCERAIELISDIIFNSIFPEKELEREKEVVIEEIQSYYDSPLELIFDDFDELLFDGHPIARNILGTPAKVKKFSRQDVLSFITNNYHTDEMALSFVGNIPFSKFRVMVDKYFSEIEEKKRKQTRTIFDKYTPSLKKVKRKTYQTHCVIGNIAYEANHPNKLGMVLLNNMLGGQSMNSRLNLSLRERNGLAYNIESNYTAFSDTGQFNVYFGTDRESLERAISLINKEFKKIREEKTGILQLSKAKKQLIGQIALSSEDRADLMLSLGKSFLLFNEVDDPETIFKKIETISSELLLEIANEILDINRLSTLIYE